MEILTVILTHIIIQCSFPKEKNLLTGRQRGLSEGDKGASAMIYNVIGQFLMFTTAFFANSGDWPMWRHDGFLTGYQPLSGNIKTPPKVVAKHFLGSGTGAITPADLSGDGIKQEYLVVARSRLFAYDSSGKQLWESNPPGYWLQQVAYVDDLDADGKNEIVSLAGNLGGTRWAFLILQGQTGELLASYPY